MWNWKLMQMVKFVMPEKSLNSLYISLGKPKTVVLCEMPFENLHIWQCKKMMQHFSDHLQIYSVSVKHHANISVPQTGWKWAWPHVLNLIMSILIKVVVYFLKQLEVVQMKSTPVLKVISKPNEKTNEAKWKKRLSISL